MENRAVAATSLLKGEDLRLELRRKDQTLFTASEIARDKLLLEDATRTQDPEERKALDDFEAVLLKKLGDEHNPARHHTLTTEDVEKNLTEKCITKEDNDRYRESQGKLAHLQRRIARLRPRIFVVQRSRPADRGRYRADSRSS